VKKVKKWINEEVNWQAAEKADFRTGWNESFPQGLKPI
jgi:hypothetical protein